jgi:hypothetical protein
VVFLFDVATVLASVLLALLASYLTYFFGIKQMVKQTLLSQRVNLYKPLLHDLAALSGTFDSTEMQSKLNQHNRELLLYAPDHVYRAYLKIMRWKKGDSFEPITEFWLTLRKELLGDTNLKGNEISEVEISAATT